ncbi:unnamed protein product [Nippostrongylus brasiliensis]|uniref:PDEase domain-containing protein n=1 Tax=Nippostrongylus brasiliensis TaxID=27835 RepID=A0A158R074_NIPBR|nr:unnamed protein product [Nippostrongylus brasiliensis]
MLSELMLDEAFAVMESMTLEFRALGTRTEQARSNTIKCLVYILMDNSTSECLAACKSPPASRNSTADDSAEEVGTSHELGEDKQISSKRKSPMDLASQRKRYARSPSFSMDSDEEWGEQTDVEDAHLIRPWVDQFQSMSRRCQRNALLQLISTCGLQHVRHVRQLIEPHFQKDFLSYLPVENNIRSRMLVSPELGRFHQDGAERLEHTVPE